MGAEVRMLWRSPTAIFLMVTSFGLLACSAATARVEPKIRVLLYRGADPIKVGLVARSGEVRIDADGDLVVDGQKQAKRWTPNGHGPWRVGSRIVRGEIVVRSHRQRIEVLNRVDLEEYVASTVGGEMSPSWPAHALRAQAVAARTYVLYEADRHRDRAWDVRSTAVSQVYRGLEAETRETVRATRATEGQILTYAGEPILAVFHSTSGGQTATAGEVWGEDLPYLRIVEVEDEDDAPHTYWRTAFGREGLSGILEAAGIVVGELRNMTIADRTPSGRVESLIVDGSTGSHRLRGRQLRLLLGGLALRSTLFEIRESDDEFVFVGSGHGHGVGMSQWGARAMARQGASYQRILARFYPGTRIEQLLPIRRSLQEISQGEDPPNDETSQEGDHR
ncbi:MAG: SpoIID/LytB domain-containing protein [Myxococcales bacterium]|nr:SpoIID/LytB domain-containing protein [Myxococcales bacterium]